MNWFKPLWLCAFASHDLIPVVAQTPQNNLVQLDDNYGYSPTLETGIQYSLGWLWLTGDQAQGRHGESISMTNMPDAGLVLFFRGDASNPPPPNIHISIDGGDPQSVSAYQGSSFQRVLWSSDDLVEGAHQIIITRSDESSLRWMTLDYLQVTGPDDWRPSSLGPHPPTKVSPPPPGGREHTTTIPGDNLTFSFTGTAVWYFSDKRVGNGWVLISIDGSRGEQVSTFLPDSDDRWLLQALCWEKTGLNDGEHQVTISHADLNGRHVSLDFFKYMPSSGSSASSSTKLWKNLTIGLAVGGGLLIIALVAVIYRKRRSRRLGARDNNMRHFTQVQATSIYATSKRIPVWKYHFAHTTPGVAAYFGVPHGSELPFVNGKYVSTSTGEIAAQSKLINAYWSSFVVSGNPNTFDANPMPAWPAYKIANEQQPRFSSGSAFVEPDSIRRNATDFWRSIPDVLMH
ncbi:hypothetical protein BDV93DRAFT_580993 [Ceratobasidium sp. AG-I]|nr:hypothetical protein BDV93DRAFT_580993 [Ceratobasidium sp. AG-I]